MAADIIIGANLRKARDTKKVSQVALGRAIGVTFQQVQKYEQGANRISASKLAMIALVLDVPLKDLISSEALEACARIIKDNQKERP